MVVETMDRNSKHIYDIKKKALEKGDQAVIHQVGEGKDLLSIMSEYLSALLEYCFIDAMVLLVKTNLEASKEDKLPEEEITAQISLVLGYFLMTAIATVI